MDELISYCKENFQLICLIVGLIGVLVSIFSVIYELKKRKQKHKDRKSDLTKRE